MEHLNGVYDQSVATCLMVAKTCCHLTLDVGYREWLSETMNGLLPFLLGNCLVICNFTMLKLKPSFLFIQKKGGDARVPSVCCDYH